jgi:hypothetical protein
MIWYLIAETCGRGGLFVSWRAGSKERKEEGDRIPISPAGVSLQ